MGRGKGPEEEEDDDDVEDLGADAFEDNDDGDDDDDYQAVSEETDDDEEEAEKNEEVRSPPPFFPSLVFVHARSDLHFPASVGEGMSSGSKPRACTDRARASSSCLFYEGRGK